MDPTSTQIPPQGNPSFERYQCHFGINDGKERTGGGEKEQKGQIGERSGLLATTPLLHSFWFQPFLMQIPSAPGEVKGEEKNREPAVGSTIIRRCNHELARSMSRPTLPDAPMQTSTMVNMQRKPWKTRTRKKEYILTGGWVACCPAHLPEERGHGRS